MLLLHREFSLSHILGVGGGGMLFQMKKGIMFMNLFLHTVHQLLVIITLSICSYLVLSLFLSFSDILFIYLFILLFLVTLLTCGREQI